MPVKALNLPAQDMHNRIAELETELAEARKIFARRNEHFVMAMRIIRKVAESDLTNISVDEVERIEVLIRKEDELWK